MSVVQIALTGFLACAGLLLLAIALEVLRDLWREWKGR